MEIMINLDKSNTWWLLDLWPFNLYKLFSIPNINKDHGEIFYSAALCYQNTTLKQVTSFIVFIINTYKIIYN